MPQNIIKDKNLYKSLGPVTSCFPKLGVGFGVVFDLKSNFFITL